MWISSCEVDVKSDQRMTAYTPLWHGALAAVTLQLSRTLDDNFPSEVCIVPSDTLKN